MSKSHMNHSPFVTGEWVEFNGWRFKNPYMIRLLDGRELIGIPNAGAWSVEGNAWVNDDQVTHIRPLADGEAKLGRQMPGGWRIARDIEMFGKRYPVWCGASDGFVSKEDIPDDKTILPIRIMAYRSKREDNAKIHLFITQGILVKKDPSVPTIEQLEKYLDVPGFWPDNEAEVLSCNELIHCINWAATFKQCEAEDPETKNLVKYFTDVIGLYPHRYLPLFKWALSRWNSDKEDFCRQLEQGMLDQENHKERWEKLTDSHPERLSKNERDRVINLQRGPEFDKTFSIEMLEVSNFMKNPLVLPPLKWKAGIQLRAMTDTLTSPVK